MRVLKSIKNPRDNSWRGWWIFQCGPVELLLSHSLETYPCYSLVLFIERPYFLRFSFELRYGE